MKRFSAHPTLPFDDPAGDGPLAVTIRIGQPSLLASQAGLETDCVNAIESARWRDARDLLVQLKARVPPARLADIESAMPFLDELASAATVRTERAVSLIDSAALTAPAVIWLLHVTASLMLLVLDEHGTEGLATRLDARALPYVYRVAHASTRPGLGVVAARALLRDALTLGRAVSPALLDDRALDDLDAADLSPAWYPVLGAMQRLWDVPKRKPSREDIDAALDAPAPADDTEQARLFWRCYQVWKAQQEPNDVVARARVRMKQLNAELFSRLL